MAPVKATEFASQVIDELADAPIVDDVDITIKENVVVPGRAHLQRGFLQVYRNVETGTVAFAWIVDGERVFGADNTGGWHYHPYDDPGRHEPSEPWAIGDVLDRIADVLGAPDGG